MMTFNLSDPYKAKAILKEMMISMLHETKISLRQSLIPTGSRLWRRTT
jgi:hypothetical protein